MSSSVRNVFDQYSQPENRLTHALMTALNEDRWLLSRFIDELVKTQSPIRSTKLSVLEQKYPGEIEHSEADLQKRGIPDGWLYDEDAGWCIVIESKVLDQLTSDQIQRHVNTAKQRGFLHITAVAIVPQPPAWRRAGLVLLKWSEVYAWMRRHDRKSVWAGRAADYLEIAEAKLVETEHDFNGTLTMFAGFPFSETHPFTYLEGKRVLKLALSELRKSKNLKKRLSMNPAHPGHGAISRGDGIWDFLSVAPEGDDKFTKHPHLTLGIGSKVIEAAVTVPHEVNKHMRRNLRELGEHGFRELVASVLCNLKPLLGRCPGATPTFKGVQRRYPHIHSTPYNDAELSFDLRTAVGSEGGPKLQPRWLTAGYSSFVNKEGSNYQIQLAVRFEYDRCPELQEGNATELIEEAWLGCKPLLDLAR